MNTLWNKVAEQMTDAAGDSKSDFSVRKGQRPLKMPKGYDFSVRNVNWKDYSKDFILRTDAVWEKTKLQDYFYSLYKNMAFNERTNQYYVTDLRIVPLPTNVADHMEDWEVFKGYSEIDGCLWQFKPGPKVVAPQSFSHYVADKEGDSWYICHISFEQWMSCNERSEVPLEEAILYNDGFWKYPCFHEASKLFEYCGPDLFEMMFELYRHRIMGVTDKAPSYARMHLFNDPLNSIRHEKQLHY